MSENMKKTVIFLFALFSFVACDKNDDKVQGTENSRNKFRVVKITGSNDLWGDNYTFKLIYNGRNQIDKAYAMGSNGDTLTYIEGRRDNMEMIYTVNDYERDAETGKLIRDVQKRYGVINKMKGDLVEYQVIEEFAPKTVFDPEDYEPEKYINISYAKYVYEYDANERIIYSRKMLKVFNTDPADAYYDNDKFETFISKDRVIYDSHRVVAVENYSSDSNIENENYRLVGKETMNYLGDRLQSINADNGREPLSFTYSGNDVKVNGVTYTLNAEGYVTKIVKEDGTVVSIEYESGAGNFETLLPLFNKVYSIPTIK